MIHKADVCNNTQARDFIDTLLVRNVELDCIGFSFYPVKEAGWKYGAGDEWDNMTLFDFQGNVLDSLALFKKF
jgi:arabinogalactan endo-1,4-beta-galactosidase